MAAHSSASGAQEVHHAVPQCLLRLRDRAGAHQEFDGESIQLWIYYELEALRYSVDPDISREHLTALIEGSTVALPCEKYWAGPKAISCGGTVGADARPLLIAMPPYSSHKWVEGARTPDESHARFETLV